ncbi:MAG: hypothetical protein J7L07_05735 [Candidatus Odinarchaeota archaeon]|nr:hypothetical protein [Candidatus Odinarchaeota archaeon]
MAEVSTSWRDLTKKHKEVREEVENRILKFAREETDIRPPIIIAPFGAGKTTLLKHLYKFAWNNKLPTFFASLNAILDYVGASSKNKISEEKFSSEIKKMIDEQVESLKKAVNSLIQRNTLSDDLKEWLKNKALLLDLERYDYSLPDYFTKYLNMQLSTINNILSKQRVKTVLLIDEVEETYGRLRESVTYAQTPIRALLDRAMKGLSPYVIMACAPVSAFELLRGPGWRGFPIYLPKATRNIISDYFKQRFGEQTKLPTGLMNFVWWASRGRPAWYIDLIETKGNTLIDIVLNSPKNAYREFNTDRRYWLHYLDQRIGLRRIDEEFYRLLGSLDEDEKLLISYLLLNLEPTSLRELCQKLSFSQNKLINRIKNLAERGIIYTGRPIRSDLLCKAALKDIIHVNEFYNLISNYLTYTEGELESLFMDYVLKHVSNENMEVVFGMCIEHGAFSREVLIFAILPLIRLVCDFVFEKEIPDTDEAEKFLEAILRLEEFIVGITDPEKIRNTFPELYQLLLMNSMHLPLQSMDGYYIVLSFNTVARIFPAPLLSPVIGGNLNEQLNFIYGNSIRQKNYVKIVDKMLKMLLER